MAPSLDDSFPPNTPRTTVDPFGNLVQPERPAPPPPGNDLFADMLGVAPQTPTGRTPNIAPVRTYEPPAPPMSLELASRPNMAAPRDLPRETAPRPTQVLPASSPVSRNNSKGPSLVQEVASWGLLGASCLVVVSGLAFAGWASEAVDLDPLLMPRFEETFSVRPPRSFVQRDDLSIDRLLEQVTQAQVRGDLAAEALGWRAVLTRNPQHPAAKSGMKTVLTKLGEPIPKELQ
jgi:hypothetical protein